MVGRKLYVLPPIFSSTLSSGNRLFWVATGVGCISFMLLLSELNANPRCLVVTTSSWVQKGWNVYTYCYIGRVSLIGGHTECFVFCGLGIPSLRSLWGAVRNWQVYIVQ